MGIVNSPNMLYYEKRIYAKYTPTHIVYGVSLPLSSLFKLVG